MARFGGDSVDPEPAPLGVQAEPFCEDCLIKESADIRRAAGCSHRLTGLRQRPCPAIYLISRSDLRKDPGRREDSVAGCGISQAIDVHDQASEKAGNNEHEATETAL